MASVATSKYRPPPRPQDRRQHAYRQDDRRPTLVQFVVLSMCLHALVIMLFGAPSGGSRDGRAMWGALQVELEASYRNSLPALKIDRAIEALRSDSAPKARTPARVVPKRQAQPAPAPALPLNATKQLQLPKTEIAPAPAPAPEAAPPPLPPAAAEPVPAPPQLVVPPLMERLAPAPKLEKLETFTVPPPTENQVVAPIPEAVKPAPPIEMKPLPVLPPIEAAPLPRMEAPVELKPTMPPPVPVKPLAPIAPLQAPSLPELAPAERVHIEAPPKVEVPPVPAAPVERVAPPVEVPISKPVERPALEAPISKPVERPPVEAPISKPVETQALPSVPAPQPVPASPAVPALPAAPAAPVVPAAPAAVPSGQPSAREMPVTREPSAPAAESSRFRAAPPVDSRGSDYDPTQPQQPLDLDAVRKRASQLGREGTGNRALLAFPMPPLPKEKSKLEKGIEKAWKPDCKTAYSNLGLAAVVPLIANEFGEGNCRW